jgi:hypothetical protein
MPATMPANVTAHISTLLGHALLLDSGFRARLQANPKAAALELNIRLTNEEITIIHNHVDWAALNQLAALVASWSPNPNWMDAWRETFT